MISELVSYENTKRRYSSDRRTNSTIEGAQVNYYGDMPDRDAQVQKSDNVARILLIVFGSIFVVFVLLCAGGMTIGYLSVQQEAKRQSEQFEADRAQAYASSQSEMQEYLSLLSKGEYEAALESVNRILELHPGNALAHNNKAWLLATCPVDDIRDGKLSLDHAWASNALSDYNNFAFLDTLAAAFAENGDFEKAIRWQMKAIDYLPDDRIYGNAFRERLALYKSGKPYREGNDSPAESPSSDSLNSLPLENL